MHPSPTLLKKYLVAGEVPTHCGEVTCFCLLDGFADVPRLIRVPRGTALGAEIQLVPLAVGHRDHASGRNPRPRHHLRPAKPPRSGPRGLSSPGMRGPATALLGVAGRLRTYSAPGAGCGHRACSQTHTRAPSSAQALPLSWGHCTERRSAPRSAWRPEPAPRAAPREGPPCSRSPQRLWLFLHPFRTPKSSSPPNSCPSPPSSAPLRTGTSS